MSDNENKNAFLDGYLVMKKWIENRNAGKTFVDYFHECGYNHIAIYDATDIGKLLYDEIKGSDICVEFFVDRNAEGLGEIDGIPVVMIQDVFETEKERPIDILVVSPIMDYDKTVEILMNFAPEIPSLALKDVVYEF